MFEAAETGKKLSKKAYKQAEPEVHNRLLELQRQLKISKHSFIIIVAGVEGAGKGEVVDKLHRWFDTRDVQTFAFWNESDEERERPRFWRFWRSLPATGQTCVMFGSWYTQPIIDKALGSTSSEQLEVELELIEELERELTADGTIIAKLWYHLPKLEQQNRLKQDARAPLLKRSPDIEAFSARYDHFAAASERAILRTDSGFAPWEIIEATDTNYRDIRTGQLLIQALEQGLNDNPAHGRTTPQQPLPSVESALSTTRLSVLDQVDLSQHIDRKSYKEQLRQLQHQVHALAWKMHNEKRNAVIVFEGWDAAGKGSALRRVTSAIDARLYRVIPIAAPSDEEKAHHYLWRFWRHIPRAGHMTLYDRSWYGRVLVERIEGFAEQKEWRRAYQEINDFESHLTNSGAVVLKFWLHISPEEQLARFKQRENDSRKQHKITEEDWRNREKWDAYASAVNDMVAHTSTRNAPWTIVPGNDKKFARLFILERVKAAFEASLSSSPALQ